MISKAGLSLLIHYSKIVSSERKSLSKARVFFLRSFINYGPTVDWLEFIDVFYRRHGFANAPWSLATLPIRAYASLSLKTKEKFSLIKNSYSEIERAFGNAVTKKLLSNQLLRFATLTDKNGNEYYLEFGLLGRNWREGALSIYLTDGKFDEYGSPLAISVITFSFGTDALGKKFILIGALQGTPYGKSRIVEVTRGLRGLRPKSLLLECCYFFADYFNPDYIVGVSNDNHVFIKQEGKVAASYDEFWLEVGGMKSADKNYLLLRKLPKRSFEEVPQKKRKDWLARQEYLQKISESCAQFFNQIPKDGQ